MAWLVSESDAQTSGVKEIDPSLTQVAEELEPKYGAVRFHREEQFEEQFVVRVLPPATLALMPKIFQVQAKRFDFGANPPVQRIPSNLPTMYVAATYDEAKAYKLAGFPSPEAEFERLVSDSPAQKIGTERVAESRGLLCAEIVYGLSPDWWLSGDSNVKLKAAEHFFAQGHADGLSRGEKWWRSVRGNRGAIEIKTTKTNAGFSVNLPIFWAPVEGSSVPEVRIYRIEVTEAGNCHMNKEPAFVVK